MSHNHLSENDLERMCLGTIELNELARLTDHILRCAECTKRLGQTRDYIHAMQQALRASAPDWPDSKEPN
jgi:anti-sigma factor RsiW